MRARYVPILAVSMAVAVTGCGGSFASESPSAIVDASASAVGGASSYVLSGTGSQDHKTLTIDLTYAGPGAIAMSVGTSLGHVQIVLADKQSYLKADTAFWTHESSAAAANEFANKWYKVSSSQFGSLATDVSEAAPAQFKACLTKDVKNPKSDGITTIGGRSAIKLSYTSESGASSQIWVAESSPHYPLRVVNDDNGTTTSNAGICDSGGSDGSGGAVNFSDFNSAPSVSAPAGAGTLP